MNYKMVEFPIKSRNILSVLYDSHVFTIYLLAENVTLISHHHLPNVTLSKWTSSSRVMFHIESDSFRDL